MTARTEVTLSSVQMQDIFIIITDNRMKGITTSYAQFEKAMLTLWGYLLNNPHWYTDKDGPKIQPTMYAIPSNQWEDIGRWITEHSNEATRVTNMMQFINIGPSAFEVQA
jgi:hypothetical protein